MKTFIPRFLTLIIAVAISISSYAQPPASWAYTVTGTNHTILIQATTVVNIDGVAAPTTDCWLGVFFTASTGDLMCGGYTQWTGATTSITAWGEDVGDDGFVSGEVFIWKIYTGSNGVEYDGVVDYMTVMPNTNAFAANGMSGVLSINGVSSLNLTANTWVTPQTYCGLSSNETVTISIINNSAANISDNFDVSYSIDGGLTWVTESVTTGITANDTMDYSFNQTADFSAFVNSGGNNADSTYNVMFNIVFANDVDTTDNSFSTTVVNMVPPFVSILGLDPDYCLYENTAIPLTGVPSGGTFSGDGVIGESFTIGFGGYPFAGPGNHCIVYTYFDVNTGCDGMDTVCVNVHTVPVATIGGYTSLETCVYDTLNLTGDPSGGEFENPYINPVTGVFTPLVQGNYDIIYTYTDANGCVDTSDVYTFLVHPLPGVTLGNFSQAYCVSSPQITLPGSPAGGSYTISGGVGIVGDILDPSVVSPGIHNINYTYTDTNGCTNQTSKNIKVFPLPTVNFSGLSPEYCQFDDSVALIGFPSGGEFSGATNTDYFNPNVSGNFTVTYSYTQQQMYYDTVFCENSETELTVVHSLPIVDLAAGNPISIIGSIETSQPDTITLNAGPGFSSYLWNTGGTNQTQDCNYDFGYPVAGYGNYSVIVTDNHGCNGSDTLFISGTDAKILELVSPTSNCQLSGTEDLSITYTNNGTYTFMQGEVINFNINLDGGSVISEPFFLTSDFAPWDTLTYTFNGELTNMNTITQVGDYEFWAVLNFQAGLDILPDVNLPNDTLFTTVVNGGLPNVDLGVDFNTGNPDTVILDAGEFAEYLWNTGENTQTISINLDMLNEYCVTVTDEFGCQDDDCITIYDIVELAPSFNKINLYPNPNNGMFTLDIENRNSTELSYKLVDSQGRIIIEEFKNESTIYKENIDISKYAKGIYMLQIYNGIDINVIRIVVE